MSKNPDRTEMNRPKKNEESGRFELRFYSGYKGKETPQSVIIGSREFNIDEIIWRKRVLDRKSGKRYEAFKCKMQGDTVKIKVFESGEWEISFSDKK